MTELTDVKQGISHITEGIPSVKTAIDQVKRALPAIPDNAASIRSNFQDIKEHLHQLRGHIQRSEEFLANLPSIQQKVDDILSRLTSSIMLQLESYSDKRQQLQLNEPGPVEIMDRIDDLVRD